MRTRRIAAPPERVLAAAEERLSLGFADPTAVTIEGNTITWTSRADLVELATRVAVVEPDGDGSLVTMRADYRLAMPYFGWLYRPLVRRALEKSLEHIGAVLSARLADAKFFFDEDRKTRLEERVKKLLGITFHQKLGSMAQKLERVRKLAGVISEQCALTADVRQTCDRAAALCKADLLTGIVGEFPELQGVMGGEYAKHDGEPQAVAQAIREQYLPRALEGELPGTLAGQVLSMADRLDSIAAFFHVGMMPTGSEDPFALRRHATAIVRIILEGNLRLNLGRCIDNAMNFVRGDGFRGVADFEKDGRRRISDFLFERVRHYGRTVHGLRDDVLDAVLRSASSGAIDLVDLLLKMKALQAVTARPEFDPLIVGFKRASRIVEKEQWDRKPVDPNLFKDAAETELHRHTESSRKDFDQQMAEGRYDRALDALVRLKPPIDDFFNGVMVNAEDAALRSNRLSLLNDVEDLFKSFADFSRIVVQGG